MMPPYFLLVRVDDASMFISQHLIGRAACVAAWFCCANAHPRMPWSLTMPSSRVVCIDEFTSHLDRSATRQVSTGLGGLVLVLRRTSIDRNNVCVCCVFAENRQFAENRKRTWRGPAGPVHALRRSAARSRLGHAMSKKVLRVVGLVHGACLISCIMLYLG